MAALVDQLSANLEPERIPARSRQASLAELDSLCGLLAGHPDDINGVLTDALLRLSARMADVHETRRPRPADTIRNRRLARNLRRIADQFVLTTIAVGAVLPSPTTAGVSSAIASQTVVSGRVTAVTLENGEVVSTVTALSSAPPGSGGGPLPLPAGAGDSNAYAYVPQANGGGGGRDGALFVSANSGGDGDRGEDITRTVDATNGDITTTTNGRPGIIVASVGGNGGNGGDGYLGASGASGGRGGAGGDVNLTVTVGNISTSGNASHGVVAQSRAGVGGAGGSGYGFSSGGAGGSGSTGGSATVTNYSTITTRGVAAHGVYAQSLGGGAGSGGGSYGLFGDGGAGNTGGQGGTAHAINYGNITTIGDGSSGVTARSVGGIGGDAGNAVGLVTFSDDGAAGGNGGSATVTAMSTSDIRTEGRASYGLFAQSVGGGGGEGGFSVGLASLGSGGGTGGNGGTAQVFASDGSSITTLGEASHGIFAQSIGGGGGNGGLVADAGGEIGTFLDQVNKSDAKGGSIAIGGQGAGGGDGGDVDVLNSGLIYTQGSRSNGVFAQSIGGGGGGNGGFV
ncbi:MAG: hypothetical protein EON85_00445, partial [Brevundimonas sp.]